MTQQQIQRATAYIKAARARAEDHLSGNRDVTLDASFDEQIRRFILELEEMENTVMSPAKSTYLPSIGHVITDCWPYESPLGEMLMSAYDAFTSAKWSLAVAGGDHDG